jgi:hypothetical protein
VGGGPTEPDLGVGGLPRGRCRPAVHQPQKKKREGQINEFHWIIGLITSESTEARRIGEVLLKDAVDHPERRDSAAQAQIIAIWSARILPDVAGYHEGDTFEIVDDEPEA